MPNSESDIDIDTIESALGITHLASMKTSEKNTGASKGSVNGVGVENSATTVGIDKSDSILMKEQAEEELMLISAQENVELDLSVLRGIQPPPEETKDVNSRNNIDDNHCSPGDNGIAMVGGGEKTLELDGEKRQDLEALAELVPGLKTGQMGAQAVTNPDSGSAEPTSPEENSKNLPHLDSMMVHQGLDGEIEDDDGIRPQMTGMPVVEEDGSEDESSTSDGENDTHVTTTDIIHAYTAKPVFKGVDDVSDSSDGSKSTAGKTHSSDGGGASKSAKINTNIGHKITSTYQHNSAGNGTNISVNPYHRNHNTDAARVKLGTPPRPAEQDGLYGNSPNGRGEFNHQSSVASMSTATQSHEVRMPMYLPNFRPATGCTNASDFIVRCFVARLRSGITVVKHGRSRWCKSRLRVLHVHPDGRSLSWKPAQGEPTSSKRPPKLDLSTCLEVRHAWSPDPLNPMFTGTPILRSKCEASNAFKSFALIFPRRTVDITAVTADQCKVLMEGFSALCYRLQVANMTGRGRGNGMVAIGNDEKDGNNEEGGAVAQTATTTNTSANR